MTEVLAFGIGLLIGTAIGAAGMWAVFEPILRLRRLERQVDELSRDGQSD